MMKDLTLCVVCSLAAVLLTWAMLPPFVLVPASTYFAWRFFRKVIARFRNPLVVGRLFGLASFAIPIMAVWVIRELLKEYRA